MRKNELIDDYDKDFYEDGEQGAQYLYMELKSLATDTEIDIDAMLEHTTIEEFMHGLHGAKKTEGIGRSVRNKSIMEMLDGGKKDSESDEEEKEEEETEESKWKNLEIGEISDNYVEKLTEAQKKHRRQEKIDEIETNFKQQAIENIKALKAKM